MAAPDTEDTAQPLAEERLGSWKAIAAYLKRDVTTVQRWERREGMPVHRHVHDKRGSVYAFRSELDAWLMNRRPRLEADSPAPSPPPQRTLWTAGAAAAIAITLAGWWFLRAEPPPDPFANAKISALTDFEGLEIAADVSPDGKFVAFLSDRAGTMDAWITQIGTGEFLNLTKGQAPELVNSEVRTLAFTPDGSLLTLWTRRNDHQPQVNVFAIPTIGGALREYRSGAVELDWSSDGQRLVFHTAQPGDPTFVVDGEKGEPRQIYVGPKGGHNHFQTWSPDDKHIYFVRGIPPDETDLWRMSAQGTQAERITFHDSRVLYPTFLDDRSLLYLATSEDGSGPWLYMLDVQTRTSRRISFGVEQYSSIAASADRSRIVATVEHSKASLWRVALDDSIVADSAAVRVDVPSVGAVAPRLMQDGLVYVSLKHDGHAISKFANGTATELWSAPQTRIVGSPAPSRDGKFLVFTAERAGGTKLHLIDIERSSARVLAESLEIRGSPTWSPDESSITVAALRDGEPQIHRIPLNGAAPSVLVHHYSINPVWSPDGTFLIYAEADSGPDFTLRAVSASGDAFALPDIKLPRGGRRVSFVPGRNALVVLHGQMRHNNFWHIDLTTGERRQLTDFGREFSVRDFDVSSDGREIVFDRRQENSDLALIELSKRSN
jgi:Tol biopolymer transport system component